MVFPACALLVRRGVSAARLTISGRALVCPQIKPLSHVRSFSVCRCTSTESSRISTDPARFSNIVPVLLRCVSSRSKMSSAIATYEEVLDLPNHPEKLLIDVRNPDELAETGKIPTSINIPLDQVKQAFGPETEADQFRKLYGVAKPEPDHYLILSCRTGRRSQMALDTITELGYRNARNYKGSWTEWAAKQQEAAK
ncbi:rhodanese domain-containing protein CG4456-like isoform X2 [Anopheles albimanus]|uniref:rhodanese domain-containing protein CG4456-like isoform X2 n=1 Tax=Anopheles albimanus TaxID=7167 RepID=UPI001640CCD3|nr:rhodanese domain-containing protein CG4456-like isoform X2 [Anopheles albimanus]